MDINEYMDGIEKQNEELKKKLARVESNYELLQTNKSSTRLVVEFGETEDAPYYNMFFNYPPFKHNRKAIQKEIIKEIESTETWYKCQINNLFLRLTRYYTHETQYIWSIEMHRDLTLVTPIWKYRQLTIYNRHPKGSPDVASNTSIENKPVEWLNKTP